MKEKTRLLATIIPTNLSKNPISVEATYIPGIGLPKSRVVRVQSRNGEIHLVLAEHMQDENTENADDFDETEIRRIMKKEISKPLLLVRSE